MTCDLTNTYRITDWKFKPGRLCPKACTAHLIAMLKHLIFTANVLQLKPPGRGSVGLWEGVLQNPDISQASLWDPVIRLLSEHL